MRNILLVGGLPDPATYMQISIGILNYNSLLVNVVIVTLILWLLFTIVLLGHYATEEIDDTENLAFTTEILNKGKFYLKSAESKILEFIWTIVPAIIVLGIVTPSIIATYTGEVAGSTTTPTKIIGNQWFWNSEYTTIEESNDSSIVVYLDTELKTLQFIDNLLKSTTFLHIIGEEISVRTSKNILSLSNSHILEENMVPFLLKTEKPIIVPIFQRLAIIITAMDVIHSFSLPECGIKMDGVPGRLNQVYTEFAKIGLYSGMCSELCGVGHSKMPVNVAAISSKGYNEFLDILK
jgi:heme/copper-type cytochrome/quinol oxidase subunit 2